MDSDSFDFLTKSLVSRRAGLGLTLAFLLGIGGVSADAKPKKCSPPRKKCGGKCVAVKTDRDNCGKCGRKCATGQPCKDGKCSGAGGSACPGNQQPCGDGCIPAGACCRDNDPCGGDGRCLNGGCRSKPACLPGGATYLATESHRCCSGRQSCQAGTTGVECTCFAGGPGDSCLSDADCSGGPCLGYFCSDCGGGDCRTGYRLVDVFGKEGTGTGEFDQNIRDHTIDAAGNLYVADYLNQRVQKLTKNGEFLFQIGVTGQYGSDNNHFFNPPGLALDADGNIYVADDDNYRVQKFSPAGVYLKTFGVTGQPGSDNNRFRYVENVAVDAAGNVYVADWGNTRVQKFSALGVYLRTFGVTGVDGSDNAHFGGGTLMVAIGPNEDLFVVDYPNYRVQQFTGAGAYVRTFGVTGVEGSDNAHFGFITDVKVDSAGIVYVVDAGNHRVQLFGPTGTYHATIDVRGAKPRDGENVYLSALAVAPNGDLYLSDGSNVRFLHYAPVGGRPRSRRKTDRTTSHHRPSAGKQTRRADRNDADRGVDREQRTDRGGA